MNVLSLFTGAGGGELAFQHLLTGFRTVGYVEFENYCQKVLLQRIKDGFLDAAPIFGDIRAFISEGYAEAYRGMVDVVTGGFPCTDISLAKQNAKGIEGTESSLWSEMATAIDIIQPGYVFVENSPALIFRGVGKVLGDLSRMGFYARWGCLGAFTTGHCSNGKRFWLVASKTMFGRPFEIKVPFEKSSAMASSQRQFARAISATISEEEHSAVRRDFDLCSRWVDRLKAIGNGQVPVVAALAWEILKP